MHNLYSYHTHTIHTLCPGTPIKMVFRGKAVRDASRDITKGVVSGQQQQGPVRGK